ncbi:MAG: ABC transporter permease [Planctomycetia bacterium]|nr:ABC transporter permease [Planctomycetia bacterium]
MTKFSGLRRRSGRSAALVFASREDVRRDFGLDKTNFLWFDTRPGADLDRIGAALRMIAERHPGRQQPVNAQGTWEFATTMFGSTVRVTTAEQVRQRINARADSMIWGMSELPLVTLLVTSLGVVNAVLASVRSRRWEMGVMRAVGLTRFALLRMILAEGLLIGLVACVLSLGFGVMAGWCGTGISRYVSFFGGMATPLVIPWAKLALGFGATLLLCLAAAMWPAVATGRREPLKLLQAGRVAM